jgi:Rrf2 family iron-sulfur cluster assembly transcriptional regulator
MDLILRNTDYALRLAANLAAEYNADKTLSARTLSKNNNVSYPLTCKLLQKFQQAGIIKSTMGPKGGFQLALPPDQITFLQLITTIQGPLSINRCLIGSHICSLKEKCPLHPKLAGLQKDIENQLHATTLADLTGSNPQPQIE